MSEDKVDDTTTIDVLEAKPKRKGNPRIYKGCKGLPGAGRPKGSKAKATLAREALAECGYDPIMEIMKHYKKLDNAKDRIKLALELMEYTHAKAEKTTNVNVNEKSVQIIWTYGDNKSPEELEQMRIDLGLIEHQHATVIDGDLIETKEAVPVDQAED